MAVFRHLLVPTDFGPSSTRALQMALDLAASLGAELTIAHVIEVPVYAYPGFSVSAIDMLSGIEEAARKSLHDLVESVKGRMPGVKSTLRTGSTAEEILAASGETGADLIVMGTHGRRGVAHALLGSVAERVVQRSMVPVLTVRGQEA